MSINARIEAALASLTSADAPVPVGFMQLDDGAYIQAFPSITYFCYLDQPEEWADDKEIVHGWYYQIDIWTRKGDVTDGNSTVLVAMVKDAMQSAEWDYLEGRDIGELDDIYHKALRFKYSEEM